MTDEQIWIIVGNILIVGSPIAFVVAIAYMIVRGVINYKQHENQTKQTKQEDTHETY